MAVTKTISDKNDLLGEMADFLKSQHNEIKGVNAENAQSNLALYSFIKERGGINQGEFFS